MLAGSDGIPPQSAFSPVLHPPLRPPCRLGAGDAAQRLDVLVAGCSSREPLFQVLAQLGDGRRGARGAEREARFGRHRVNTEKGAVVPRDSGGCPHPRTTKLQREKMR